MTLANRSEQKAACIDCLAATVDGNASPRPPSAKASDQVEHVANNLCFAVEKLRAFAAMFEGISGYPHSDLHARIGGISIALDELADQLEAHGTKLAEAYLKL